MPLSIRGIKARPCDIDVMITLNPDLIEMHCSVQDLEWQPTQTYPTQLAVHLPEYCQGQLIDPASIDETRRQQAETLFVHAAGRAAAWAPFFENKSAKIVFHPGGMSIEPINDKAQLREQLGKTIEAMKAKCNGNVELLVENLPGHCWFFGGDWLSNIMTTGNELAETCGRHKIGATLDLCHIFLACNSNGLDPLNQISLAYPYIDHIHYSDARGTSEEGLQIGEGELPLLDYFSELKDLDVVAVPEIWFGHENGGARFLECWERAERIMRIMRNGNG